MAGGEQGAATSSTRKSSSSAAIGSASVASIPPSNPVNLDRPQVFGNVTVKIQSISKVPKKILVRIKY